MFPTFAEAIQQAGHQLLYRSEVVHSNRWQGMTIEGKPEMATHEITHCTFGVHMYKMMYVGNDPLMGKLRGNFLGVLQNDIKPNLPWADDHFDERVSGAPMNPGTEWKNWPYGKSAARFLEEGKFNHNYMERYWPKHAGDVVEPTEDAVDWRDKFDLLEWGSLPTTEGGVVPSHRGIRYEYGDLSDVVKLLADDPLTRQAYLPMWFPEDTGGGAKRAPCTLGYHFLARDGFLDIDYHIRSCDYIRHFRDDIYLTARLVNWVLGRLRQLDLERWQDVRPGKFIMHIGSLHVFRNDFQMLKNGG
jgi:hypothetical protein